MKKSHRIRTCSILLLGIVFLFTLGGCKKEILPETKPAPVIPATPAAPTPQPGTPTPAKGANAPEAAPNAGQAPRSADRAAAPRAASPDGAEEAEATVLKVRKLRGGRTTFSSAGVSREKAEASYEVQVGLADGTRFSFLPLKNVLTVGSKVMVRYLVKDGKKIRPVLPVAVPVESYTISADVLPPLLPTPVGDGTFSITFPNTPDESKTDLGMLYRYEYKFSKSYYPDTYYFFRTSAEGGGSPKFFKDQAVSLLALTGGKRVEVRIDGVKTDKKTGLKRASGRLTLEIGYFPKDGAIQLWFDAKKEVVYGAWVLAYSPNQLAANEEMWRAFFGSFTLKPAGAQQK
jgi:hypothetical protein